MKFSGKVIQGAGRGKGLGFPTANLDVVVDIDDGIYFANVNIHNAPLLPALIFVGAAETFGEAQKKVEVYILDFSGDLYGKDMEVEILKKLRGNIKFDLQSDLVEQMKRDELAARQFFQL